MAKIKMKYRDFELEIEGEEAFVESKIKDFPSVLDKVIQNNSPVYIEENKNKSLQITHNDIGEYKSVNSFLNEKNFDKDVDLILGCAYYICRYEGKQEFTSNDIKILLKKAKQSSNKNIAALLNNNISKGFVEETGGKIDGYKAMVLINDGLDYIENYIPKAEGKRIKKKTSSAGKSKISDAEKNIISLISQLDRYNSEDINKIKDLKNQKQIILNCIYLLNKTDGGLAFSANVLYELIRKIGLNIERATIAARISETKSYYDKAEDNLLKLSNYGKEEIEKFLSKKQQN